MYLYKSVIDYCFKIIYTTINHNVQVPGFSRGTTANADIWAAQSTALCMPSSPPPLNLTHLPPPHSSLCSSLLPGSPERRSHAADLLYAIWLTSCHPYPRRGCLCRGYDWRTSPAQPPHPSHLPPFSPPCPTPGPYTPGRNGREKQGKKLKKVEEAGQIKDGKLENKIKAVLKIKLCSFI